MTAYMAVEARHGGLRQQETYILRNRSILKRIRSPNICAKPLTSQNAQTWARMVFKPWSTGGRVQVYEINTNPTITAPQPHPSPTRKETEAHLERIYRGPASIGRPGRLAGAGCRTGPFSASGPGKIFSCARARYDETFAHHQHLQPARGAGESFARRNAAKNRAR